MQVCCACTAVDSDPTSPPPPHNIMVNAKSQTSRDVEVQTPATHPRPVPVLASESFAFPNKTPAANTFADVASYACSTHPSAPATTATDAATGLAPPGIPPIATNTTSNSVAPLAELRYTVNNPSAVGTPGETKHPEEVAEVPSEDFTSEPKLLIPMLSNVAELYEAAAAAAAVTHPKQPPAPQIYLTAPEAATTAAAHPDQPPAPQIDLTV